MAATIPSLLAPVLVLLAVLFLAVRLGLFSSREVSGRAPFLTGSVLLFLATFWQVLETIPDYNEWFVISVYEVIDLIQFIVMAIGALLIVAGIALYADSWQTRREGIERSEGKLSILENLQHDARQPYHTLELLNIALREMLVHYPMAAGAIFLVNRARRQLVLTSSSGLEKKETALLEYYPLERNIVSQAVELGDPLLLSRFDFIDRSGNPIQSRFNSCLILPLISGMEKVGVMLLFSEERQFFSRADIRHLDPVVHWLAEKLKSARLTRELSQERNRAEGYAESLSDAVARVVSAARAANSGDPVTMFCKALVGLASSDSVHLCGLRYGRLEFYGGSEALFNVSESLKTALVDALDRTNPLIINQEAAEGSEHKGIALSCLICPIGSADNHDAILLQRSGQSFAVGDQELKQLEGISSLAQLVLLTNEFQQLSLTRRKGFEVVLQLLKSESLPASFSDDPGYFLKTMIAALPVGSFGISFLRSESGLLVSSEIIGVEGRPSDDSLAIEPGEGGVGRAFVDQISVFDFGHSSVVRHFESYEDSNQGIIRRLSGERGEPVMLACCPVIGSTDVMGVVMFAIHDIDERERQEWERLITLSLGLYSLHLTMQQVVASDKLTSESEDEPASSSAIVNEFNNHLSAISAAAELASGRQGLPADVQTNLERIVEQTEKAARTFKRILSHPRISEHSTGDLSQQTSDLNEIIESVMSGAHVSGDLYLIGSQPTEILFQRGATVNVEIFNDRLERFFTTLLQQFTSLTGNDEVVTLSTYMRDDHVFLDVCRHLRNLQPARPVADHGSYRPCSDALRRNESFGNAISELIAVSDSACAVDSSQPPAYVSFMFQPLASQLKESTEISLLAVDDQQVILDLITAMGHSMGYKVTTALSGEEALRLAQANRYDIVLTDLSMPGMSGLDLSRRLSLILPEVPVILVTGWEAQLEKDDLLAAGISDVLYKPFKIEQLTDLIRATIADSERV